MAGPNECDPAAGAAGKRATRVGFAFALVTGLSFTNHLTTVLLAPGLLVVTLCCFGFGAGLWRRVGPLVMPFVLGWLP